MFLSGIHTLPMIKRRLEQGWGGASGGGPTHTNKQLHECKQEGSRARVLKKMGTLLSLSKGKLMNEFGSRPRRKSKWFCFETCLTVAQVNLELMALPRLALDSQ